jgi:2-phospho-L-lactate guanylyltransferase
MSGGIVAVVPVKLLSEVKGRLSPRLSPAERADFALQALERVLFALRGCASVDASLVVSPDLLVLSQAIAAGANAVDESKSDDLAPEVDPHNRALEYAREVALQRWQPSALLVLAADLPLVGPGDIAAMLTLGEREGSVVIAPDRAGTGTNGIFLRPPGILPFHFGSNSYQRHVAEARRQHLRVENFWSRGTAHDVDLPRDLDELIDAEGLAQ